MDAAASFLGIHLRFTRLQMAHEAGPDSLSRYAKTRPVQIRTDAQLHDALVYSRILILQVVQPSGPRVNNGNPS